MITASGTKYYYHYDGLGSVVALSNSTGNVVERYEYDVFGSVDMLDLATFARYWLGGI